MLRAPPHPIHSIEQLTFARKEMDRARRDYDRVNGSGVTEYTETNARLKLIDAQSVVRRLEALLGNQGDQAEQPAAEA
ncbi:hypothetical protein CYL17_18705 (plasmid) [Thermobispora bispora]|nr:hypothetical protein CYL17_18705 [Thermobispora bispora]